MRYKILAALLFLGISIWGIRMYSESRVQEAALKPLEVALQAAQTGAQERTKAEVAWVAERRTQRDSVRSAVQTAERHVEKEIAQYEMPEKGPGCPAVELDDPAWVSVFNAAVRAGNSRAGASPGMSGRDD